MKKTILLTVISFMSQLWASTGDRVQVFTKDFPYICKVLIMKEDKPKVASICSGTLLSPTKILTARHCKPKNNNAPVIVECNGQVSAMLKWSNYLGVDDPSTDMAMITLAFPIKGDLMWLASDRKHASELLKRNDCYIMGYGKKEILEDPAAETEFNAVRLQQASFEALNLSKEFLDIFGQIESKQFVVSGSTSLALSGDSGGPVVCRGQRGFYQVAVHSFGSLESELNINVWAPDFSASVHTSPALPWIKRVISE
ncbi:MAG TPA: trypsin-like serine protease [Bacteriovoracaceae bacterium]|nr:trypsin-like serine protease [Bacteriovoracaceae bacterium]